MSDELNMPDDLRLADQLAACEARLAAHPLASSSINRDELLYRAGWAACEAHRQPAAALRPANPSRAKILAWSTASAALAASLAVAATLRLVSAPATGGVEPAIAAATPDATSRPGGRVAGAAPEITDLPAFLDVASLPNRRLAGSLGAAQFHLLSAASNEPVARDPGDDRWTAPKSERELRRELLPRINPTFGELSPPWSWPWRSPVGGESI